MPGAPPEAARGPRLSSWPLAVQVFAAVAAAVGVVFGGSFLYDMGSSSRRLAKRQVATLNALSPFVQALVEDSMLREKREHIGEVFAMLNGHRDVGTVELIDPQGRLVDTDDLARRRGPAATPPPGTVVLEVPLESKPACARCHGANPRRLGTVRLTAQAEQGRILRSQFVRARLVMAVLGALCVAMASLFIVRRLIHCPMGELTKAMAKVAEGRFDVRLDGRFPGELRVLADGFNTMVGEIARDRREILELHRRQVAHMDRLATLGELAAHLAHEVRNPLTGLSSALQVMEREAAEGQRRDLIGKMLTQLGRMDRTMGDFLRYARMPEAARRRFDLREAVARVTPLMAPRLKAQGVALEVSLPEDLPKVYGDPSQLEQVVLNLALNAAQAMPAGGRLALAASARGKADVLLTVTDTGKGIPPENLRKVFEPFFTTREGGSGLGLPIARQIVMAHGGELRLESRPGSGTTAFVRLPTRPGVSDG